MRRCILFVSICLVCLQGISQATINAEDAKKHIGEVVTLCGKIYSAKYLQNAANKPTLLNLGGNYPNQLLTVTIFEIDRKNFPFNPEDYYPNVEVCVTGKLVEYKGSPEMIVQSPEQVKVQLATNVSTKPATAKKDTTGSKQNQLPPGAYDIKLTIDVNLRAAPSLESAVVSMLKAGSIVSVVKSDNGWSYVLVKKGTTSPVNGYIKNSVLK